MMREKKIAASLLCGVTAASLLAGCGEVDKSAVVATFDDTEVSLGVANFAARLQQASYDDFYAAYFGNSVWDSDLYGDGTTMEDEVKSGVLDSLFESYTLQAHAGEYGIEITDDEKAAITAAASEFIAGNDEKALAAMGADQAIVEEYLTLMTIQGRMYDAVIAEADTAVSDEEANTSAYSYVRVSKTSYIDEDGDAAEYTEDELKELAETVKAFGAEAKEKGLESAAEDYAYTVSSDTFTADDTLIDENVLAALKDCAEGAVTDVIETDGFYYVARLDAKTDAGATENKRQELIEERQSEYYDGVVEKWKAEHTWTVDEKVWERVSFDNLFTTMEQSTEMLDGTELLDAAGDEVVIDELDVTEDGVVIDELDVTEE